MSPRQSLQLKAAQHAAQYQQSLQAYAQNQIMEHSLNQMKQNISQLNSFLAPQSAHSINPLSSMGVDPLYDAPPATPVYHADEIEGGQHMSVHMSSPTNVSFDSGASSPNSRASSEHRDSICKISSEDLLNFQASAEAQALMLQSLNSLQPQDIQERIAAMGSLFGLDADPFSINLKHISSLSGLGSGSPVSC